MRLTALILIPAAFVAPLSKSHTNKFAYTFKVKTKECDIDTDLENFTGKEMLQLLDATGGAKKGG